MEDKSIFHGFSGSNGNSLSLGITVLVGTQQSLVTPPNTVVPYDENFASHLKPMKDTYIV